MGYRHDNIKKYDNLKNKKDKTFTGIVQGNEKGYAFIIPEEDYGHDFFVPRHAVKGAYHGDKVLAAHVTGTKDEAYVIKILERGNSTVIGTFARERSCGYVYPDNTKQPEIFIPLSSSMSAKDGDKVVCEITSYPNGKAPGGKIVEILGEGGDLETEELSIIRSYGLEEEFPEDALNEARRVSAEKIKPDGREDFRNKLIFTIDGEDTRDIDDGISLERQGDNFVLGVHIADVSHYVLSGTALDEDAYGRGTSVYFPDRVLPMLPKELSNGACSLNENEEKYALSCLMTFTPDGRRLDYKICKSVIKSRRRTTYTEMTALCDGDRQVEKKYPELVDVIKDMEKLCLAMEKRREAAGNVTLDVKDAHIYVDKDGNIIIPPVENSISRRIIEQFMISANEAVAEFLQTANAPCLYRIHESPSPEKASAFFSFLSDLGINARCKTEDLEPADFQRILKSAEDKPYYSVINKVMLRSMQKARYSEENSGHFGLASECYCHFTSPIRRYPDLFVHRSVKAALSGKKNVKQKELAHSAGIDCSARERIADECERKVDELYKLYYMADRLGEEYCAVVSGVTNFGVFCELENTIEGLIPLEDLPRDNYTFYEEKLLLCGGRHSFKLGDKVKVKVADCDLGRMRVLFKLLV